MNQSPYSGNTKHNFSFSNLLPCWHDVGASLVVFLVALPLALGIALASGAPSVVPGLIGCAVGGIVIGALGGAPLQVSGPAAGLTVIVYDLVHRFGWETTCLVTAIAGLLQIVFGQLRLGKFCLAISPAVVHGMLAGIGIIIASSQLHVVLGGVSQSSALQNLISLPQQVMQFKGHAVFLGTFTFLLLFCWRFLPRIVQKLPAQLGAVAIASIIANFFWLDVQKVSLPQSIGLEFIKPSISWDMFGPIIIAAITVTAVASVESLLCAVATDKLHTGKRANLDRELVGQGVGNLLSGIIGGLPLTGVVVRSTANISAGARTQWSAVLHGLWVVVLILVAKEAIELIPLPALAGLLVQVGVSLVNLHHIKELSKHRELPVYIITVLGVVFWNLLGGVAIGLVTAFTLLIKRALTAKISLIDEGNNNWSLKIGGIVSFLVVPQLASTFSSIPAGSNVKVHLYPQFMDHSAFDAIEQWQKSHLERGGQVEIMLNSV